MAVPYIETPRTEVDANATYLTNGFRSTRRHDLSALGSPENSFQSPSKDDELLKVAGSDKRRGLLKTPKTGSRKHAKNTSRIPLPRGEFTPLLNSVAKNNTGRDRHRGSFETPSGGHYSRHSALNTPGLPSIEDYGEESENTGGMHATPLPQAADSSMQSSPLAPLPGRSGNILGDGQMMTLKEQELSIDKLEKENFGLKLKVHFLEEQLNKTKPEYKEKVNQENVELNIAKVTLQRDVQKYKKTLKSTEENLLRCQQELQDVREKAKRRYADEDLKRQLDEKEHHIQVLSEELESAKRERSDGLQELKEEIENLQYDLREKDRAIDAKDEEIEKLQVELSESNVAAELEGELENAKQQIEELRDMLKDTKRQANDSQKTSQAVSEEKARLAEALKELQKEVANKSSTSGSLHRQMEERATNLERELESSKEENLALADSLHESAKQRESLEGRLAQLERQASAEKRHLESNLDDIVRKYDMLQQERDQMNRQLRDVSAELHSRDDGKSSLQKQYSALVAQYDSLENDLVAAKNTISELEDLIDTERQQSATDMEELRVQYRDESDGLRDQLERLKRQLEDKIGQHAADKDKWESLQKSLQIQKEKAEQQAASYKRTVDKLQGSETTLSSKEEKLKSIIDSETLRHKEEEALLNRQIEDLNKDIASKREAVEAQRTDLLKVKEELRVSRRDEGALKEKVQALEDEIVILQSSLEEQAEFAKGRQTVGNDALQRQLQAAVKESREAHDKLLAIQAEKEEISQAKTKVEAEKEELRIQLEIFEGAADGNETQRAGKEDIAAQKTKSLLETRLNRMKQEKEVLRNDLEKEVERAAEEENKLLTQIDQLHDKLHIATQKRDRELLSAKNQTKRLQQHVEELEGLLAQQTQQTDGPTSFPSPGSSLLRRQLDEARLREKHAVARERELDSSVRDLKSQIDDLEHENQDLKARMHTLQVSKSPSTKVQDELSTLRKQLSEAQKQSKALRKKTKELERVKVKEEERKDLHELLKSSTLEAESLALRLSEREAHIERLRLHLQRVREERGMFSKRVDEMGQELDALEQEYQASLKELNDGKKGKHAKEIKGLGKEITWLRIRLLRERKFREDLAWSKGLMELGERVRAACNETDLRMISEMGVPIPQSARQRSARRKLRASVWAVVALKRMQKLGSEWQKAQALGEGLRKAKADVVRRRAYAKQ